MRKSIPLIIIILFSTNILFVKALSFGETGSQSSNYPFHNRIRGTPFDAPENGTLSNIGAYIRCPSSNNVSLQIWNNDTLALIDYTANFSIPTDNVYRWHQEPTILNATIIENQTYMITAWASGTNIAIGSRYLPPNNHYVENRVYGSIPSTLNPTLRTSNQICLIYANYTVTVPTVDTSYGIELILLALIIGLLIGTKT